MTDALVPADLNATPPTVKLVFLAVDAKGPVPHGEIVDETSLSKRSVTTALNQLQAMGLVEKQENVRDARRPLWDTVTNHMDETATT